MVEQIQEYKERPKRSSYSDFIGEAEQIPRMKEGYEMKLLDGGNFEDDKARTDIISQAMIMTSELRYMFTKDEALILQDITEEMTRRDKAVQKLYGYAGSTGLDVKEFLDKERAFFKKEAYEFLGQWQTYRDAHNLGLQSTTDKGEIEAIYKTSNIPQMFRNQYGVLISPQMECFDRWLKVRTDNMWHNVVVVDGTFGVGKSSFIYGAFGTLEAMNGRMDTNLRNYNALFFKEKRGYCKGILKKLDNTAQVWYDEAGNQFGKSSHWEHDQVDLITEHALQRESVFTNWMAWGDKNLIDSDIRNYTATALISIKERGLAILRQFNENPHSNKGAMENSKIKNKIVKTSNDAQMILENDALTRMIIPFYDPSYNAQDLNWKAYKDRKHGAKKTESSLFAIKADKKADDFYLDFLLTIDKEYLALGNRITTQLLSGYAKHVGQYMSMNQVASRIAKACGTSTNKIFVRDDAGNQNNGYVIIDEVILSYLERKRAEYEGAKKYKKEEENNANKV